MIALIPFSSLLNLLNFEESQVEKFISFMVLLISALSIFPDSKRLQDRSINGLYAIFPYLAAIPLQFQFVTDFLLKIYIICTWILKAYILSSWRDCGFHEVRSDTTLYVCWSY